MKLFISGIGTGIGKTLVAAVFTEALQADYWKPVQAGDLDFSDSLWVKELLSNTVSQVHAETFRLSHALSPHAAAAIEGVNIALSDFRVPGYKSHLVIEGAGGLMVPLNKKDLIIDLVKQSEAEVVLVSRNYLGSINHTLMSWEVLKSRNIPVKGIVFNGEANAYSEEAILERTGLRVLLRIPELPVINRETVKNIAKGLVL